MSRYVPAAGADAHLGRLSEEVRIEVLHAIEQDAQTFAPVDTGELRGSIHVEGNAVVADADHAAYVELGTRNMHAQPYLAPSLYRKRRLRGGL